MPISVAKSGIDRIKPHMIERGDGIIAPPSILLNSNESAYGPSPLAVKAVQAAASKLERYFEFADEHLTPVIGGHFELDPSCITIGQGSDDLLARVARAYLGPGDELIRSKNGYLKVPNYAYVNDAEPISAPDNNFVPSVDNILAALSENTRIVYLANPENPAGTYLSGTEIRRLHSALPDHVLLVLDCAYEEYVDAENYEPGHILVGENQNVVMCRTFSKIYGLAGARIGWLYGPEPVVDRLRRISLTFPISSTSAAAVRPALEDREHIHHVFQQNRSNRSWLSNQMSKMGFQVIPSQTNFLLVKMPENGLSADDLDNTLLSRGIAIRRFAAPAYVDYVRITIGLPHELKLLVSAIAEILELGG